MWKFFNEEMTAFSTKSAGAIGHPWGRGANRVEDPGEEEIVYVFIVSVLITCL